MSTKNIAASFVLALLFISLIVIYLVTSQNPLVTSICVTLLAISLFVTIDGGWREIGIVGAFGALVSLVAVTLLGRAYFGTVGSVLLTIVWGIVVLVAFRWISGSVVRAPADRAVIITNLYTGNTYRAGFPDGEPRRNGAGDARGEPIAPPIFPLLERKVATVPLYELDQEIKVEKINTQAGHNLDTLTVQVRYKIVDWKCALDGIPNRGQGQIAVAKEISKDLDEARNDPVFWEKMFTRQMDADVKDVVRDIIFATEKGAADVYKERRSIAVVEVVQGAKEIREKDLLRNILQKRLSEQISRWGAEIISLDIDHMDVASDRFSSKNPMEREAGRVGLIRKAEADAEVERVKKLVEALKSSGVTLSERLVSDIVVSAIQSSQEWGLDNEYEATTPAPGVTSAKPDEKKSSKV